jgi:hypothetical protein
VAIRDNNLARAAQRRAKPNSVVRDTTPTVDQQLARLEDDMRRLKIEFDVFFNGAAKKPPYDTKGRVETAFKRLADDRSMTFAQRYLLNSLGARYTAFKELWRRTLQGREEGRVQRPQRPKIAPHAELEPIARVTFVCADAQTDVETVKNLYAALVEAKRSCNESVDDLPFPKFHHMIANKTRSLKQHLSCDRVKFSVAVENGQVNFKAKADLD